MFISHQAFNELPDGSRTVFTTTPISELLAITQAGIIIPPDAYAIQDQETIVFTDPPIPENGDLRIIGFTELRLGIIRVVAQQLEANTTAFSAAVTAVDSGQATWIFGDEEVLPTSAELKANLLLYEVLTVPTMNISALLAAVRAWEA